MNTERYPVAAVRHQIAVITGLLASIPVLLVIAASCVASGTGGSLNPEAPKAAFTWLFLLFCTCAFLAHATVVILGILVRRALASWPDDPSRLASSTAFSLAWRYVPFGLAVVVAIGAVILGQMSGTMPMLLLQALWMSAIIVVASRTATAPLRIAARWGFTVNPR
ncbi:hypothetical protein [Longispora albida]|uniref:hypothetical protein n=1 Tax=Longispora albida TaxID=203523 RepID=UPI0012F92E8E|nr:hypothetical protein [Longispora albida]